MSVCDSDSCAHLGFHKGNSNAYYIKLLHQLPHVLDANSRKLRRLMGHLGTLARRGVSESECLDSGTTKSSSAAIMFHQNFNHGRQC